MERTIWKYLIPAAQEFVLDMPEGKLQILDVQMQNGAPVMWASINLVNRITIPHKFRVVPTGLSYNPEGLTYIGTFQPEHGLTFHLFSVI